MVGLAVGLAVGTLVGFAVGLAVGTLVGNAVGFVVGFVDGLMVGFVVGFVVGNLVGFVMGLAVGLMVGFAVGSRYYPMPCANWRAGPWRCAKVFSCSHEQDVTLCRAQVTRVTLVRSPYDGLVARGRHRGRTHVL